MHKKDDFTMQETLALLKAYTETGWATFPVHGIRLDGACTCARPGCPCAGKHPWTRNGVKDATRNLQRQTLAFSSRSLANIGVATGQASGIIAIDIDPRHGGFDSLAKLESKYGALTSSLEVITGGGGRHILYACPDVAVPNSAGRLGVGIDVRGDGGYIVTPPSRHHTGNAYLWRSLKPTPSTVLQQAPAWLLAKLNNDALGLATQQTPVKSVMSGQRNGYLTSIGGAMRRKDFCQSAIDDALQKQNSSVCTPPLPAQEVSAIARSLMRYPAPESAAHPRSVQNKSAEPSNSGVPGQANAQTLSIKKPRNKRTSHAVKQKQNFDAFRLFADAELEPWPDPVASHELYTDVLEFIEAHATLNPAQAVSACLWVLFSWVHNSFSISPILAVLSPEKRCGKTTLLTVLKRLTQKPLPAANITAAALFRSIDKWSPTLLIDEADTFLEENQELRGILNSGHNKEFAFVVRSCGEDFVPRSFSTWCPKVLAKIGQLPTTLTDRSIIIRMHRRPFSGDRPAGKSLIQTTQDAVTLRRRCARWADDNMEELCSATLRTLEGGNERSSDNWQPLLLVAQLAGPEWFERAQKAARTLCAAGHSSEESPATLLLEDLLAIFTHADAAKLSSRAIVDILGEMEHRPWPEWRRGTRLTPRQLATLLDPFGVTPKVIRVRDTTVRGYERAQFGEVFARYLNVPSAPDYLAGVTRSPAENSQNETTQHNPRIADAQKKPEIDPQTKIQREHAQRVTLLRLADYLENSDAS